MSMTGWVLAPDPRDPATALEWLLKNVEGDSPDRGPETNGIGVRSNGSFVISRSLII